MLKNLMIFGFIFLAAQISFAEQAEIGRKLILSKNQIATPAFGFSYVLNDKKLRSKVDSAVYITVSVPVRELIDNDQATLPNILWTIVNKKNGIQLTQWQNLISVSGRITVDSNSKQAFSMAVLNEKEAEDVIANLKTAVIVMSFNATAPTPLIVPANTPASAKVEVVHIDLGELYSLYPAQFLKL